MAVAVAKRGIPVIAVTSDYTPPQLLLMQDPELRVEYVAHLVQSATASDYTQLVKEVLSLTSRFNIIAVIAGSELGVECADILANTLQLPTANSLSCSLARRDKYVMGETVRKAGVRAVQQARVSTRTQVRNFLQLLKPDPFRLVVKPIKSAGSDGVYLCHNEEELYHHFHELIGVKNALGHTNDAVIVQEFLCGPEYVVDTVSLDGQHKCVAMWLYDKREFNGAAFVYFGMTPIACSPDNEQMHSLWTYAQCVLDALEIRNGPSHGEFILTKTGPCLVEVGARAHGGEGTFIPHANRVFGYNQVDALVDAYVCPSKFVSLPSVNSAAQCAGYKVYLVSHVHGTLKQILYLDEIAQLASFMNFDSLPHIGSNIEVTHDVFSMVGVVVLAHPDPEQVERDKSFIRSKEPTMFQVDDSPTTFNSSSSSLSSLTSSS